jgi:hypothetical protein
MMKKSPPKKAAMPAKAAPMKASPMTPPAHLQPGSQRHYEAKDAMHTLKRAEEIKSNPKLMSDVHHVAKHETAAMQRVARLAKANSKAS